MRAIFKTSTVYLSVTFTIVLVTSLLVWKLHEMRIEEHHIEAGQIFYKTPYFLDHIDEFDAVVIGDSKAFCAIHPDLIDPVWNKRTFNLAHWANWLPTQYAALSDLIASLPKGFIVIWSLGHQNFNKSAVRKVYPPGYSRIPFFVELGYPLDELLSAQLTYETWPSLWMKRELIYTNVENVFKRPLMSFAGQSKISESQINSAHMPGATQAPVAETNAPKTNDASVLRRFEEDLGVGYVTSYRDDKGRLASVGQYKRNGAYLRTELRPEYYRSLQERVKEKQAKAADASQDKTTKVFTPDPAPWTLFTSMLDMMKNHDVLIIVNVLEEAPYTYGTIDNRDMYRRFMNGPVRQEVEKRGGSFVYVNFDVIDDSNYFDYDHMNKQGIETFNSQFAPILKSIADGYASGTELR